jgi:hypothetical protein
LVQKKISNTKIKLKKNRKKVKYFFKTGIKVLSWVLKLTFGDWDAVKLCLYNDENSDEVSPLSSQAGGLPDQNTTTIPTADYWEIMNADLTVDKIEELLNADPADETFFAQDGFVPLTPGMLCEGEQYDIAAIIQGDVMLDSPSENIDYSHNGNMEVAATVTGISATHMLFSMKSEDDFFTRRYYENDEIQDIVFLEPDSFDIGTHKVTVLGLDTVLNRIAFDSTSITVIGDPTSEERIDIIRR